MNKLYKAVIGLGTPSPLRNFIFTADNFAAAAEFAQKEADKYEDWEVISIHLEGELTTWDET